MTRRGKTAVDFSKVAANVIKTPLENFVEDSFLPYAHYVIMSRALIADDGLKPVQRRILFAMHELGLTDKKDFIKAAQVVGETMGKYHPHGDASIGDALSRMGQTFAMRVPLVDVQGSVGFTTGDDPAAPRYWEARPTSAAMELIKELNEGSVEMGLNYDGKFPEPTMLPIKWPNGVINGSQGIAVGYSCNILPHNPSEVMDAIIALVKNPDLTFDQLQKIMPGPDMPTGGVLLGHEGVREYYETGRGTFSIRGKYEIFPGNRGTHIVSFSEAPYQVSAEQIVTAVEKGKKDRGRFKEVSEIKDLSDIDNGFKLNIRIKSGANPQVVLKDLFRWTPLEQKFSANMNILIDGVPVMTNMKDMLQGFIDFRSECIVNKVQFKLADIEKTIERLEGIVAVLVDIDKAINIIRKAEDAKIAGEKLQKSFKINEEQANYILSMPLRRLTKSDSLSIQNEVKELHEERKRLEGILNDEDKFNAYMIDELKETKKVIADERRTQISTKSEDERKAEEQAIKKAAKLAEKNVECYVTMFADGTVVKTYEPFKQSRSALPIVSQVRTKTRETLLAVTRDGNAQRIPVDFVPLDTIVGIETTGLNPKKVIGFGKDEVGKDDHGLLIVTDLGGVNVVNGFPASDEFLMTKLDDEEQVLTAIWVEKSELENKSIVMVSSDANVLHFRVDEIRTSNSGAGTVKGMILEDEAMVAGASIVDVEANDAHVVSCTHTTVKVTSLDQIPGRKRAAKGVRLQRLSKDDQVINAFASERVIANKNERGIRLPDATDRALVGEDRAGTGIVLGHHAVKL